MILGLICASWFCLISYRVLKLQNGLTALLISDPGKGLREEDACHAAASDESDDDSSDESSEDGSSGEEDEEEEEKDDDRDHTAVKKKRKHGSEKLVSNVCPAAVADVSVTELSECGWWQGFGVPLGAPFQDTI